MTNSPPKILLIQLEFPTWVVASKMAYSTSWALEEGLTALGFEVVLIPGITVQTASELSDHTPGSWLKHAQEICRGHTFDQVWIEACHLNYDEAFLEWASSLATVRVALITECLNYDPSVLEVFPYLGKRREFILQRMRHFTHALTIDERDAPLINSQRDTRALYWCHAVPSRCVQPNTLPLLHPYGIFVGSPYGDRMQYLNDPELKEYLKQLPSPEDNTPIHELFDRIGKITNDRLNQEQNFDPYLYSTYINGVRQLRRAAYDTWLDILRRSGALVCLPQIGNAFSNRPFDGMTAGRPVVHFRLPGNSYSDVIFEDQKEWVLYSSIQELRVQLPRVLKDRDLINTLVQNGLEKIRSCHLLEKRMSDVQRWITEGVPVSPIGGPIISDAEQLAVIEKAGRGTSAYS